MNDVINNTWTILSESGSRLIDFTSYISDDWRHDGKVLTSPIEEGGLASYNKINQPLAGYVTLALQGTTDETQRALTTLEKLRKEVTKFSIVTPDYEYKNMTLESYSRTRQSTDGASLLVVELYVVEVRESKAAFSNKQASSKAISASQTKDASCASTQATGKTKATTASKKITTAVKKKSVLYETIGRVY